MLRYLILLLLIDRGFGASPKVARCGRIAEWSFNERKDLLIYGIQFKSPSSNDAAFDIFVQDASGKSTLCRSVKKHEFKPKGDLIYIECGRVMEGRSASIRMKAGALLSHCGEKVEIVGEYKPIPTKPTPRNKLRAGYSNMCEKYHVQYKYHGVGKTWADSVKRCVEDGGELVLPQSAGEAKCLVDYVAKHASKTIEFALLNLKVKNGPHKSHLLDSSDNRRSYMESLWSVAYRQPDRGGSETCVGITTGGPRFKGEELGKLHDIPCSWKIPYVCERRTVPSGYKKDCAKHGVYYKYHTRPLSFTDSQKECKKEGGELVVPQSAKEAQCLVKFVARTASKTIEFALLNLIVKRPNKSHILDSSSVRRSYMESLWSVGYHQPDRAGEFCVGITTGGPRFKGKELGKLHDIPCSWAIPFVCAYRDVPFGYKGDCANHGVYYKYHDHPLPFTRSQKQCRDEGGKLADPLNAAEARCLIGKYLPKWINKHAESFVYLDLKISKPYKKGIIKGLGGGGPVRKHMNAYWSKGYRQPDGHLGEQCVGVTTGGARFKGAEMYKLHDMYCVNPRRFVCEFRK